MNETCDAQAIADRVYNAFQCDNLWCEGDLVGDVQDLADEYDRLKAEVDRLRDENAKLIAQVQELWRLVNHGSAYGYVAALEHIEELGIEVDG